MEIQIIELLPQIFSLIFIIITIFIGAIILSKYFILKSRQFLFVGIAWMGMAFPSFPEVISLFIRLFNLSVNNIILFFIYVLLNLLLIPVFFNLWFIAFMDLLQFSERKKRVLIMVILFISIIIEIILIYLYIFKTEALGFLKQFFLVEWTLLVNIILIFLLGLILFTGLIFAIISMRSKVPEIALKGKILFLAFIIYTGGAILDALFTSLLSNIIARGILVIGSICFYFGFILPEFLKKILLKVE
ncbi:MAG: hypothetical protein ACTSYC_10220 [Promethearchaeota archaeon]